MTPSRFRELPTEDQAEMIASMKVEADMRAFDAQERQRELERARLRKK